MFSNQLMMKRRNITSMYILNQNKYSDLTPIKYSNSIDNYFINPCAIPLKRTRHCLYRNLIFSWRQTIRGQAFRAAQPDEQPGTGRGGEQCVARQRRQDVDRQGVRRERQPDLVRGLRDGHHPILPERSLPGIPRFVCFVCLLSGFNVAF